MAALMNCTIRGFATSLSIALLCLTCGILLIGCLSTESFCSVRIAKGFHIGVRHAGMDSRFVLFNNASYGPYTGSVVGLMGADVPARRGFGDSLGVYYRHLTWPHDVVWTLAVSFWYPILLFAIWPCCAALIARRRAGLRHCR